MVKKNILYTIGSTPMVRINALCPNPRVNIYAKLEGFNPTGSIKDRIAVRMVEAAIKSDMRDAVIEAIEKSANTGKIGDGKIFVYGVEQVDSFDALVAAARRALLSGR